MILVAPLDGLCQVLGHQAGQHARRLRRRDERLRVVSAQLLRILQLAFELLDATFRVLRPSDQLLDARLRLLSKFAFLAFVLVVVILVVFVGVIFIDLFIVVDNFVVGVRIGRLLVLWRVQLCVFFVFHGILRILGNACLSAGLDYAVADPATFRSRQTHFPKSQ